MVETMRPVGALDELGALKENSRLPDGGCCQGLKGLPRGLAGKPGKILFVSTYNIQCGLSTYTENLTAALEALKCNLLVLANRVLPNYYDTMHGKCEYIRCWDRHACVFDCVKKEIEKYDPSVVHIQFEQALFAAGPKAFIEFLAWLNSRNIPVVMTPHSIMARQKRFSLRGVLRKRRYAWFLDALNKVDAVIVHTKAMKDALLAWGFPESKIEIIPHGVEIGELVSPIQARRELDLPLDKKIILSFGLIAPSKNIHENILVISRLSKRFPEIHYLIAGFPQVVRSCSANAIYANELRKQVEFRRNMNLNISFIPHDRIKYYLCAADIYLLNYARTPASSSGNACLSLAYGIPSVASRAHLLDDMTEDVCLKVDINAPRQVEQALERLLTEPDLRKRLGQRALEMARTRAWDKIAALHLQLYARMTALASAR